MFAVPQTLRRASAAPALVAIGASAAVLLALPTPARSLNAADILRVAQSASNGETAGQCKVFANTVVATASRGRIALSKYHDGYADAGAQEVPLEAAGPGDIIQVTPAGSTDATAESFWRRGGPLHTAIVERNLGGGRFQVIDSNWGGDERVSRHIFTPREWADSKGGGIIKAWRFGSGAPGARALGDGSFVRVAGTQGIYRLAGAAPLPILSWEAIGGEQPVVEVDWSTLNNFAPFPVDGTVLQAGPGGPLYTVRQGIPTALKAGATPGREPVVVDPLTIRNAGGPGAFSRLRSMAFAGKGIVTRVAVIAAPKRVKRGASAALRARITAAKTPGGARPVGSCAAELRRGTKWLPQRSAALGADGTCRVRVTVRRKAVVRVAFAGATGWRASASRPLAIGLR